MIYAPEVDAAFLDLTNRVLQEHTDLKPQPVNKADLIARCRAQRMQGLLLVLRPLPPGWLSVRVAAELYRCGKDPDPWPFKVEAAGLDMAGRLLLQSLRYLLAEDGHFGPWGAIELILPNRSAQVYVDHRRLGRARAERTQLRRLNLGMRNLTLRASGFKKYQVEVPVDAQRVTMVHAQLRRRTNWAQFTRQTLFWSGLLATVSGMVPLVYHARTNTTQESGFSAGIGLVSGGLTWAVLTALLGPPRRYPILEFVTGVVVGAVAVVPSVLVTQRQDDPAL